MGAHHGAVGHHTLHVGIITEVVQHRVENTMVAPARKAFVDGIPLALLLGQFAPLGAGAQHPKRRFDKPATLGFLTNVNTRMVA